MARIKYDSDHKGKLLQRVLLGYLSRAIESLPVDPATIYELTVAGNLKDMFAHVTAADDLTFRYGIDAPTLRVDGMTVAGQ